MEHLIVFLRGGSMVAAITACLFFLRFWKTTRDRLFLCFALFFGLLVVNHLALFSTGDKGYYQTLPYLIRLAAFIIVIFAIVDRNRR